MFRLVRNVLSLRLKLCKLLVPKIKTRQISGAWSVLTRSTSTFKPQNVYLIDEDDSSGTINTNVNKFTKRTHNCGELNIENVGETVTLCGWLQYQRLNKFVVLRDSYGETQLLVSENDMEAQKALRDLPLESIIEVKGSVLARPKDQRNKKQATGDIEVYLESFKILNRAKDNLPFNIREFQRAKESLRMQYRYLDLRFPVMQRNLRVRSEMLMKMREFLVNNCGFVDVETPTLFKATPGGAQEFIVPTRFPGQFYSLVQSPQQFKQMLMAGAVDRYFQIARCYRDETSRPDRQPEFTQLDIEMSFTDRDGILELIEQLLGYSWPKFLKPLPSKFPRMTFDEVMETYGTDQPDIRFGFKFQNCTDIIANASGLNNVENFGAYCIVVPKEYANLGKAIKEKLNVLAKQYPDAKLVQNKVTNNTDFITKIGKLLTESAASVLVEQLKISDGDVIFLSYGRKGEVLKLLGKIRLDYVDYLESLGMSIRQGGMHLLWILDFPLFEPGDTPDKLSSAHHPFTSPNLEDLHLLTSSPLQVRSLSFDLVLNGFEIGGGSIRIHDPKLQEKVFEMLDLDQDSLQHILEMLSSGCPPHGGIALGLDRIISKILNTLSIRDVIAFPKTFEGRDPLSGAPSKVSDDVLKMYNVKSTDSNKK